ncbi:MAG: mechanosensitive ion channel family protein [Spirochaetaceae bacterium]|jgi:MscS family membrane protein|nr:mechanosensitive ion channel family protein [Spirochaetaceae bacterium]
MDKILSLTFLNNSLWQWFIALVFVAGGFFAGLIIVGLVQKTINKSQGSTLHNPVMKPIRLPLVLLFVFAGFFLGFERLVFSDKFEEWESKILASLFIILVCWLLTKIINSVITRHISALPVSVRGGAKEDSLIDASSLSQVELKNIIQNFVTIIMCIIPVVLIFNTLGYNISAILAGLGIGGAAIALASKGTLENFFGSISIFIDKPFHLNDRIKITDQVDTIYDGWVIDMGLRISRIMTLDNRIITIPNSFFTRFPIQNVSSEPHTKVVELINVGAAQGYEKICKAISILKELKPPGGLLGAPSIACLSTLSYGVFKITYIFFIAKNEDYWEAINAVNLEVLRQFEEAGIAISNRTSIEQRAVIR